MVTPSADTTVSNGVYVPGGIANGDVKSAVSTTPLADFLMQLEEYTPTVGLSLYKTQSCCHRLYSWLMCVCDSAARELGCPWFFLSRQRRSSVWICSWPCWPFRFLTQWQATTSTGLALRPLIPECKTMTALSWVFLFLHYRCLHQELITDLIFVNKPYANSAGLWAFFMY